MKRDEKGKATLTQEEFEIKCKEIHGDKYDYSLDSYKGMSVPYKIKCKEHGVFSQKPIYHIHNGSGCSSCAKLAKYEESLSKFKQKLHEMKGHKYRLISFSDKSVTAVCEEHGQFKSTKHMLLNSKHGGCPSCKMLQESDTFITKAKGIHGNVYSYVRQNYKNSRTLMEIYCNKHQQWFSQRPSAHLQGQGCPLCGNSSRKETKSRSTQEFILKSKQVFGDIYDYTFTDYENSKVKVVITCPVHGEFSTSPKNHLSGFGCRKCSDDSKRDEREAAFFSKVSGLDKYNHLDFSHVVYVDNRTPVDVLCTTHNEWFKVTTNKIFDTSRTIGCKTCKRVRNNRWTLRSIRNIAGVESKTGFFYSGKIEGLSGCKIGFTSSLEDRLSGYNQDLKKYYIRFDYKNTLEVNYLTAVVIETVLKKLFKSSNVVHDLEFGGKNEVYDVEDCDILEDIFNDRWSLEFDTLALVATHNNHPAILSFVNTLSNYYKEK